MMLKERICKVELRFRQKTRPLFQHSRGTFCALAWGPMPLSSSALLPRAAATAMSLLALGAVRVRVPRWRRVGLRTLARLDSLPPDSRRRVLHAISVIQSAFALYGSSGLALSFNGGKDCLVVLHLIFAALAQDDGHDLPQVVYFFKPGDFAEMTAFMRETARTFRFPIRELDLGGFKQGLEALQSQGVRGVLMGQRRTDPYAPQAEFASTSPGWPDMMRINPILDLDYAGVWAFLRACGLTYCSLYDEGYTSLGSKDETSKHPQLVSPDSKPRPAHSLQDADERAGRSL
jgi:FAD synthetase